VVTEDGTIFFPYVGVIKVQGKTTSEVREILSAKLAKFIERVQLDVRMVAFRSQQVYVVGEVARPGIQQVTDVPMTVLDAVNRAGGFTAEADFSRVLLTRRGTTYLVDIQAMYDYGATESNPLLEQGDIVNVADRSYNKVFVLGEITKPGSLVMNKKRSTLAEALSDAGYINQSTADPRWIYVMRGNTDTPELFHLDCTPARRDAARRSFPAAATRHHLRRRRADRSLAARDCQHPADGDDARPDEPDAISPFWRSAVNLRSGPLSGSAPHGRPPAGRELAALPC
jgi:polysaccharide export outer membrane protein